MLLTVKRNPKNNSEDELKSFSTFDSHFIKDIFGMISHKKTLFTRTVILANLFKQLELEGNLRAYGNFKIG